VRKHDTEALRLDVYNRLIAGQHQAEIARVNRCDKSTICRITKALLNDGYIRCVDPFSKVKFYQATKKMFSPVAATSLHSSSPRKTKILRGGRNVLRISRATFQTEVRGEAKKEIKWDSGVSRLRNGVVFRDVVYPFANIGDVRFRRITGSHSDVLQIILPEVLWEKDAGEPFGYLKEMADRAGTWFMKRFCIDLGGLECVVKPDIGAPIREPELVRSAQRASFNVDGVMVDTSAPDCIAEFESKDYDVTVAYIELPKRVLALEERLSRFEELLGGLDEKLSRMLDVFDVPSSPDDLRGYV